MPVQEFSDRYLAKASMLSSIQMPKVIPYLEVIEVLSQAKISFVLVGAYGLASWLRKPRATEDVDVVVAARQVKRAVKAIVSAFPYLESVDLPVVVRLRDRQTQDVMIDVMKPVQQPYVEVFHHTQTVTTEGRKYRIPSLEMALVMKFSAMTSLYRADADKFQDAHDFILLVQNNADLEEGKLAELAQLVYPEAGKDVLELVRKVRAGEKLSL
jgi:hypothetical protein